jgi:protein phosphatase
MKDLTNLSIPEFSLVVLIGASGSGKSTFAARHFKPNEIISSDTCRAMVSNDENDQAASAEAFALARYIAEIRLRNGLLTVIDATNVQESSRKDWIRLAREYHCLPVALVIDTPETICTQRNRQRTDRTFGAHVIPQQISQLRKGIKRLKQEGFRNIIQLQSEEELNGVEAITRVLLYNNKKEETGPLDITGDVHGCYDELLELLDKLGYQLNDQTFEHPEGRKLVFVGDLVDRGPKSPAVLGLVMDLVERGCAYCVPGNHDLKLMRWLNGRNVQIGHGLDLTIGQLENYPAEFKTIIKDFIDGLVSHYVFDGGRLVVAHAGLKASMQGRGSAAVREFCLYGETTGEINEFGLPVRFNWASEYQGSAMVVYGHTPVPEAQWLNRTIDIDTGCVFGGSLTALRIMVKAAAVYCEPVRPLTESKNEQSLSLQQQNDEVLDIADFMGKQIIKTRYGNNISIRESNAIAALEVMSRFAVNPKWLIYLPPTMSPSKLSSLEDYLEHPAEGFAYFKDAGVTKVVCQQKHMGSRAVVIVARDTMVIKRVFGIVNEGIGVVYTRTGRPFFYDKHVEQGLLERLNEALERSGFYEKFKSDWVCLDTELMPWNAKAQALLESQYAAVGTAGTIALAEVCAVLGKGALHNAGLSELSDRYGAKKTQLDAYVKAYHAYCWPVTNLEDYKLAPFHILATADKVWTDQNHEWHMENISHFCRGDTAVLRTTNYRVVDMDDEEEVRLATEWWLALTGAGGEGMVIKPYNFIEENTKGLIQPAIKIRGREYLRIIYGPEYTSTENIARLKERYVSGKRSLALREFALGIEGLERFINQEPLRNIHQCVFGVLALESEIFDPRL